ncbi:allantoinase AllB [Salipaludibacillus sp. HK11]|uniref:allantoinase AllB n=1 Tax=Salipaludibacillus sp. HK11 TaxID=3394320 RepID=UPI0039FC6E58
MKSIIINGQVFDGSHFTHKTIIVENGFIEAIVPPNTDRLSDFPVLYDAKGTQILPGFIDVHVHFNEPGRAEWEGIHTGSAGAAAGGITTVFDMPLNSHPSANNATTLKEKKKALQGRSYINFGLWGGMTADVANNNAELDEMLATGIVGFKGFLSESGIDDFKRLDKKSLSSAMEYCSQSDTLLALHAEWEDTLNRFSTASFKRNDYRSFLRSRPVDAELDAVSRALDDAAKFGTKLHIVHVSHPDVVDLIQVAKKSGINVSLETCPHYLLFNEGDFLREGAQLKCAPPLRDKESVDGLWTQIKNGAIDFISSDHSPCPISMKPNDEDQIWNAWGGIQGVQFGTTAFISEAKNRGIPLTNVLPLLTSNVANRFPSLEKQGKILPGNQANLSIYNPNSQIKVEKDDILFRHKYSPYVGRMIEGQISATIVNGHLVYERKTGITQVTLGKDVYSI